MYIQRMELKNFRNYSQQEIKLEKGINLFYGDNAQGKTNILEAVFLCSVGKSFRAKKEKELINLEKKEAQIEVEYEKLDRTGKIQIQLNEKKNIYINGIKQQKMSDLIGTINVVMFSPDDIEILKSGPANRRKFLNIMISQLKPKYIYLLNLYNKTLEERNHYLRLMKCGQSNPHLLEIWDEKLAEYSENVYKYRAEFIQKIKSKIEKIHMNITNEKEEIKIKYISDCQKKEEFLEELKKSLHTDIQKGYTTKGIHRDDFYVYINKKQVNVYGSQGQNRTVILSLKLAELEVIREEIGEEPILLLDDFMSELDQKRRRKMIESIQDRQVLITCTEKFEIENKPKKIFFIKEGKIEEIENKK